MLWALGRATLPSTPAAASTPLCGGRYWRKAWYHLGNLYAKLGLKGRKELRRFLVASRRPAPA